MDEKIADIRIVKSRKKIKLALINLLNKYRFDEISVKDICKTAEISRGTFYLHYQDKYDLVLKYQKSVMIHAKRHFKSHKYENKREFIKQAISFWESEGELLLLLLSSKGSSEIQQLVKSLLQKHMELNLLPFITNENMSQKDERYFLVFLSNAVLGVLQEWIDNDKQETSNGLTDIIDKITTNVLR
ncbi:TPA: TetR/AcrR family transcriptional regulator [Staphylococcus aureus]|nr:TetR/AcrR family transcriptional regulator [Staphylococcus aureus]HDG8587121.1 TetR/AcrR family transcriptional regulator [Staphylococcus aureus]HDZ3301014.1 TetR/AcrR family transcriptional regulator [Staphylococcus aureus]HDZ3316538.1 TetR/AcrR family transcriptional regulator [Staphylococcus aureus]HDZ3341070.1 TetR/AcrR family transcriptional regulator [Staphylococcus aureus]